jgi:hypothetical protein
MEHRCGSRRALELTVLVRRRGWAGSVVARLSDISISGAFLQGPPEAFPLYSLVHLEATPPGGASTRLMTCKAMVARVGRDGVGLVFDQVRPAGLAPLFAPVTAGPPAGGSQADRTAGAAARPLAPAGTSGTGSSTQLPDSRRAGHGTA